MLLILPLVLYLLYSFCMLRHGMYAPAPAVVSLLVWGFGSYCLSYVYRMARFLARYVEEPKWGMPEEYALLRLSSRMIRQSLIFSGVYLNFMFLGSWLCLYVIEAFPLWFQGAHSFDPGRLLEPYFITPLYAKGVMITDATIGYFRFVLGLAVIQCLLLCAMLALVYLFFLRVRLFERLARPYYETEPMLMGGVAAVTLISACLLAVNYEDYVFSMRAFSHSAMAWTAAISFVPLFAGSIIFGICFGWTSRGMSQNERKGKGEG